MENKFEALANINISEGVVTQNEMVQVINIIKEETNTLEDLQNLRNSFVKWHSANRNTDENSWDEAAYQNLSGVTAVIDHLMFRSGGLQ